MSPKRSVARWLLVALVGLAACGGKSCSCIAPLKGGYPVNDWHENAIQVRASQSLFQYLSQNGLQLVGQFLPGGGTFNVPPQCGGSTEICCGNPAPQCRLQITPKSLGLTPAPTNQVNVRFNTGLRTLDKLPAKLPVAGDCTISIDSGAAGITITGALSFDIDAQSHLTQVSLQNPDIPDLSGGMLSIEGGFGCAVADALKGALIGLFKGQLTGQLGGIVSQQLCAKCASKDDCNGFATACTNGVCMGQGGACIQELGIEGRLDLASALGGFSPGLQASIDVLASAGGFASADTGLSLGVIGGGRGDPHSACVPVVPAPANTTVAPSATLKADTLPDGKTPFHLGVGIHKSHLDRLGWALFDSGGLCLEIGTRASALLTSETFGLIIPSLSGLTNDQAAPMLLALRPTQPPTFTLGKGTFKTDTMGQKVVDDPLLRVKLVHLGIDFYAFVSNRYLRVMTLTADVDLPLALDVDGQGRLTPILGDAAKAFQNLVVSNTELLSESPAQLAAAFPTLLSVAISQLTGTLQPIALPALMGIQLRPLALTSIDPVGGANQLLALYANLGLMPGAAALAGAAPLARALPMAAAPMAAAIERLDLPPTEEFAVSGRGERAPTAFVRVDDAGDREHAWSLDGGPWSAYTAGGALVVRDARLWLQGHHELRVRGRQVGDPASLDAAPVALDLVIDTVAPSGSFDIAGNELRLRAHDAVTPPAALRYRVSVGGRAGDWSGDDRVTLPAGTRAADVRVEARDEAGNVGALALAANGDSAAPRAGGCAVGGPGGDVNGAGLVLLALVSLGLVRRRARAHAARGLLVVVVVVGVGAMALGGCGNGHGGVPNVAPGDQADPKDQIGRFHDAVAHNGVVHISAYDDSVGDLVYAGVGDVTKPPVWDDVDGVDLKSPAMMGYTFRHGITAPGPDVGQYTSLALDGDAPRIAYFDVSNGALKLARGPHPWAVSVVDGGGDGQVGLFAALSLAKDGTPAIAYQATGIADGSGKKSELRLATAKKHDPAGPSDWDVRVVDSVALPAPAPGVMTGPPDFPPGVGLFVQALRDHDDRLLLVYFDQARAQLKLARQGGDGSFAVSVLDGAPGAYASARLGSDGTLHVVYADAARARLSYLAVHDGAPPAPVVIDDGVRPDGLHKVGADANLVLGDDGSLSVVYQDQTAADLAVATSANGTSWSHMALESGAVGYGFWPHQVRDGGHRWLTEFVYDRSAMPLGGLRLTTLP